MIQKVERMRLASAWRPMKGMLRIPASPGASGVSSLASVVKCSTVVRATASDGGRPDCSGALALAGEKPGKSASSSKVPLNGASVKWR